MLNANQILEESLIKLDNAKGKPAQVGYDLSIKQVNKVGNPVPNGIIGRVLKDQTILNTHTPIEKISLEGKHGFLLYEGVYDVIMNEGCKIAPNRVGLIRQRSSLMRNGAIITSSVFDPGFETDNVGTYMIVFETIFIEEDARVAQMYFHECTPVSDDQLYNGQWQKDKQRQ
jgi:deoxycytidine triphosphate deaminase